MVATAVALGIYIGCTFEFGKLGEDVYYAVNPKTSSLVIFGNGTMPDYGYPDVNYAYDFWDPEENKWSSELTFEGLYENCDNGWMEHDMWKTIQENWACFTYTEKTYSIPWLSILFGIS